MCELPSAGWNNPQPAFTHIRARTPGPGIPLSLLRLSEFWKLAENRDGTVLRFLEVGNQTKTVDVQIPHLDVKSAWSSDALERKQAALETTPHGFRFTIKPFQIVTVRLEGAGNVR